MIFSKLCFITGEVDAGDKSIESVVVTSNKLLKVWWPHATLFVHLFSFFTIHAFIQSFIQTIRRAPSPYLYSCSLSGWIHYIDENLGQGVISGVIDTGNNL
jgi:hypothetical protein